MKYAMTWEALIDLSFRRMPESILIIFLDSRFRGNDNYRKNSSFSSIRFRP